MRPSNVRTHLEDLKQLLLEMQISGGECWKECSKVALVFEVLGAGAHSEFPICGTCFCKFLGDC